MPIPPPPLHDFPMAADVDEDNQKGENGKSMFLVVSSDCGPFKGVLYKFEIQQGGIVSGGVVEDHDSIPLLHPDYTFYKKSEIYPVPPTILGGASFFGSSKVYVMQHANYKCPFTGDDLSIPWHRSLKGMVFDSKTRSLDSFSPPIERKPNGPLIPAYGKIYYIADPACRYIPDISFERYDPATDCWEPLPPYPSYAPWPNLMQIVGYAVCHDCILFSLAYRVKHKYMIFHVNTKEWHDVKVCTSYDDPMLEECPLPFHGLGMVVGDTIYALAHYPLEIVAFSLRVESNNDCLSYFIDSAVILPGLDPVSPPSSFRTILANFIVPLGNSEYCLIQTGFNYYSLCRQHLCVTTFRIVNGEGNLNYIKTLHSTVLDICLPSENRVCFVTSFTPDFYDTETEKRDFYDTETEKENSSISVKQAKQECDRAFDAMEEKSCSSDEEIKSNEEENAKKRLKLEGSSVECEMHPSLTVSICWGSWSVGSGFLTFRFFYGLESKYPLLVCCILDRHLMQNYIVQDTLMSTFVMTT